MQTIEEFEDRIIDGYTVHSRIVFDENPDTSFIGEYTDDLTDGVIVREFAEFYERLTDEQREEIPNRGREFQGFKPYAGGEKSGTSDYYKYGMQDYKRMEGLNNGNWQFVAVVSEVSLNGIELGTGSLWGIESDSDKDYFETVRNDCESQALAEAKRNRAGLCKAEAKS